MVGLAKHAVGVVGVGVGAGGGAGAEDLLDQFLAPGKGFVFLKRVEDGGNTIGFRDPSLHVSIRGGDCDFDVLPDQPRPSDRPAIPLVFVIVDGIGSVFGVSDADPVLE